MEGTETGAHLHALHEQTGMILMGCDQCCHERGLSESLIQAANLGCFPTLYAALASTGVDQVITLQP